VCCIDPLNSPSPLVATQANNEPIRAYFAPDGVQRKMQQYCGSVAYSANGEEFVATAPRGSIFSCWASNGEFKYASKQGDVCGVAALNELFVTSDGYGRISFHSNAKGKVKASNSSNLRWDNHLTSVG
jgi:hypothetical protein